MDSDGIITMKEISQNLKEDMRRRMIMGIGIDIDKMVEEYDAILRPMKEDMGIDEFELQLKLDGYRKGLEEGFGVAWDLIIKRETGLWHDMSEKPAYDSSEGALNQIVLAGKGKQKTAVVLFTENDTTQATSIECNYDFLKSYKWAYLKDLIIGLEL